MRGKKRKIRKSHHHHRYHIGMYNILVFAQFFVGGLAEICFWRGLCQNFANCTIYFLFVLHSKCDTKIVYNSANFRFGLTHSEKVVFAKNARTLNLLNIWYSHLELIGCTLPHVDTFGYRRRRKQRGLRYSPSTFGWLDFFFVSCPVAWLPSFLYTSAQQNRRKTQPVHPGVAPKAFTTRQPPTPHPSVPQPVHFTDKVSSHVSIPIAFHMFESQNCRNDTFVPFLVIWLPCPVHFVWWSDCVWHQHKASVMRSHQSLRRTRHGLGTIWCGAWQLRFTAVGRKIGKQRGRLYLCI